MGLAALAAAQITPRDLVLEPSAGTGLLAVLAEIAGGSLALNELAETRADLLQLLFPGRPVTMFDAAQIDDHLDAGLRPSVILMNPPFSVVANVDGRTITLADLPDRFARQIGMAEESRDLGEALGLCDWNVTRAARVMGMSRATINCRIRELDLRRPERMGRSTDIAASGAAAKQTG